MSTCSREGEGPRVAPADVEGLDERSAALIEGTVTRYGRTLNLFTTLANHPDLFRRWMGFARHSERSTLGPRERELLILRTSHRCGCHYEWLHHVAIGRECGLTDDEIEGVREGPAAAGWSDADAAVLAAVDGLYEDQKIDDELWARLASMWSTQQVLDAIFTVGLYVQIAMALNTLRVEFDG